MSVIKPEDVCAQSLDEMLGSDPELRDDLDLIKNAVQMALFSGFPRRRQFAREILLPSFLGPAAEIATVEDNKTKAIYAYIGWPSKTDGKGYFLVDRYHPDVEVCESPPSPEEFARWPILEASGERIKTS